jgi:hypothetical protein
MFLRAIVAVSFFCVSPWALADSFDINLSSDSVQMTYASTMRSAEITTGALYNNDQDDWAAHLGLVTLGSKRSMSSRSEVGLGGRIYAASVGDNDVLALALGGQFRWFPGDGIFGLGGQLFYAPDIVTGGDSERFWEAGVRLELEVVRQSASIYVGYRKVETRLDNGPDLTLDKGGHAGVHIRF